MPRATLPAAARLHRPSEFAAALRGRRLARGALFILTAARPDPQDDPDATARLGLVVAKRLAPRATTRNALKRVAREAFRHGRAALPPGDYVLRLHAKVEPTSLTAVKSRARAEADAHFKRAAKC